VPPISSAT